MAESRDDRLDRLLDEALATGEIRAGVTAEERALLADLLRGAESVRAATPVVRAEAAATMPSARARFERFVAANQPSPALSHVNKSRGGLLAWLFAGKSTLALAGTAAAIAILGVAAIFAVLLMGGGVETAAAQVLTPGDYVQIEGVVTATGAAGEGEGQTVVIDSELGPVEVAINDLTSVIDGEAPSGTAGLKKGARVLVAGVVEANAPRQIRIAARTLALATGDVLGTSPKTVVVQRLRAPHAAIVGQVVAFTLSPDGLRGQVVVETADGRRYAAHLDAPSIQQLVTSANVLGARVELTGSGGGADTFALSIATPSSPGSTSTPVAGQAKPRLVEVRGTFVSREGPVFTIETAAGPREVLVQPDTRIVAGQSGIVIAALRRGELPPGTILTVSGGIDRASGRVIADVILIQRGAGR